jgi:hypothetical protein
VTSHDCKYACRRFGRHKNGLQRFQCKQCGKTFTETHERPLDEMRLPLHRAEAILGMLCCNRPRLLPSCRAIFLRLSSLAAEGYAAV